MICYRCNHEAGDAPVCPVCGTNLSIFLKVKHLSNETESELRGIVDLGGTIVDVFVWHKVYGKVSAKLWIYTLEHVDKFMEGVRTGKSSELMHITGGYHYHTVRAESTDVLDKIENYLQEKNFLVAGE